MVFLFSYLLLPKPIKLASMMSTNSFYTKRGTTLEAICVGMLALLGGCASSTDAKLPPPCQNGQKFVSETFDSYNDASGWSNYKEEHTATAFGSFMGPFSLGESTEKTFAKTFSDHTRAVTIEFLLYEIKEWNGELIYIEIGDTKITLGPFVAGIEEKPENGVTNGIEWSRVATDHRKN